MPHLGTAGTEGNRESGYSCENQNQIKMSCWTFPFAAMAIYSTSCSGPLLLSRAGFLRPLAIIYVYIDAGSLDGEGAVTAAVTR